MTNRNIFFQAADRRTVLGQGLALAAATAAYSDGFPRPSFAAPASGRQPEAAASRVVELRQYTLHPGRRDDLVELFDREFLESQEALGARVIGEFRDLDYPDRFVWLRGFPDMATRKQALTDFYSGPVWQANRAAANATMIDSDNVLLLRPAAAGAGFRHETAPRPPQGATQSPRTVVAATIWSFTDCVEADTFAHFMRGAAPVLEGEGAGPIAVFITEPAANNFPALPVREGEHIFVWFSVFESEAAERACAKRLDVSPAWNDIVDAFAYDFTRAPETLRLAPTARSRPVA